MWYLMRWLMLRTSCGPAPVVSEISGERFDHLWLPQLFDIWFFSLISIARFIQISQKFDLALQSLNQPVISLSVPTVKRPNTSGAVFISRELVYWRRNIIFWDVSAGVQHHLNNLYFSSLFTRSTCKTLFSRTSCYCQGQDLNVLC